MKNNLEQKCCNNPQPFNVSPTGQDKQVLWCSNCEQRIVDGVVMTEKQWDEYFQKSNKAEA